VTKVNSMLAASNQPTSRLLIYLPNTAHIPGQAHCCSDMLLHMSCVPSIICGTHQALPASARNRTPATFKISFPDTNAFTLPALTAGHIRGCKTQRPQARPALHVRDFRARTTIASPTKTRRMPPTTLDCPHLSISPAAHLTVTAIQIQPSSDQVAPSNASFCSSRCGALPMTGLLLAAAVAVADMANRRGAFRKVSRLGGLGRHGHGLRLVIHRQRHLPHASRHAHTAAGSTNQPGGPTI